MSGTGIQQALCKGADGMPAHLDMTSETNHNKPVGQYPENVGADCTDCSWGCNRCPVATVGMTGQYTYYDLTRGNVHTR